jgi:tRNA(fMet)-specific endonuclease VapC
MEYLLDTDTISYYCKRHPITSLKIPKVEATSLYISVISAVEIDYGYATNQVAREAHQYRYTQLLSRVNLIEFSGADALYTAKIRAELYPQKMGKYDALLAGTAIARDLILVTNNTKHFAGIYGLKLENWTLP